MQITFGEWEKTDSYGGAHARAVFESRFPGQPFDPFVVAMVIKIPDGYGVFGHSTQGRDRLVRVGRYDYATVGDDII